MTTEGQHFDITSLMAPYLDVHMVSPLLDFLREINAYDAKKITLEKIRAVEHTNMIEFVEEEYERFPNDEQIQAEYRSKQREFAERKQSIFDLIDNEPSNVQKVAAFFGNEETIKNLQESGNYRLDYIASHHGLDASAIDAYYKFSKFKYECGMYKDAEEMLTNYLDIIASTYQTSQQNNSSAAAAGAPNPVNIASIVNALTHGVANRTPPLSSYQGALWGRLACRVVQGKWILALTDLHAVKESIDVQNTNAYDQLRQRAWLLHWSLFVYLNQRDGIDALVDLFSERYYLQTMENLCPWLLRYYIVAIILSPTKRRSALNDALQEIASLSYVYSDPITQFLDSLFDAFDFDIAQVKLQECQNLVKSDFFLQVHADRFVHEARVLICEMYTTVNCSVDLTMLAQKLQLSDEEAEKWVVDMVRGGSAGSSASSASTANASANNNNNNQNPNGSNANSIPSIDAKIDSLHKQVIIAPPSKAATQTKAVLDSTKELTNRTAVLAANLESLAKDQALYILNR